GVGPFASAAVDHADALVAPAPTAEIDVAVAAFAVVRAGGIVAEEVSDAQARCFGHDATPWRVYSRGYDSLRRILLALFVRQDHHRKLQKSLARLSAQAALRAPRVAVALVVRAASPALRSMASNNTASIWANFVLAHAARAPAASSA